MQHLIASTKLSTGNSYRFCIIFHIEIYDFCLMHVLYAAHGVKYMYPLYNTSASIH